MAVTASLTAWPATASALREILKISSGSKLKCHGQTKKGNTCQVDTSQANTALVARLLDQIIGHGSFEAARALLDQVAHLINCQKNHQKGASLHLSAWEKVLGSLQSLSDETDDQDDGSTSEEDLDDTEPPHTPRPVSYRNVDAQKDDTTEETTPCCQSCSCSTKTAKKFNPPETTPSKDGVDKHHFEPFGPTQSTTVINTAIKKLLLRPLMDEEKQLAGRIYIFTFPSTYRTATPLLKIGYSKDLKTRMASWKSQCGYTCEVLGDFNAEHYAKVEKLVHKQLTNQRKRETGCPGCGVWHKEWFNTSSMDACKTVGIWTTWTRREPYDDEGNIKDEWRSRIESVDLSDPSCWESLVNGVYDEDVDESELSDEDEFQWSSEDESQDTHTDTDDDDVDDIDEYETYDTSDKSECGDWSDDDD
ncbi:hypothetical protein FZEAL_9341 [Fusarium zealandicum]|uniref:Bacteriophage T5 Orf172 DNA-binding domain-containing protein n=1 Tax=Fusarium zealandicum TaxID=1053134 RepID=A0A8H4XFM4_9HYPO|nr:hypothetical protein FZEAL_9341 [Fusarium zealandicum]